jgi:hypothetical protein
MGHNDVCQDSVDEIPTDEEFRFNASEALELLRNGLEPGATIYVVGMSDVTHLYNIAKDKKALGIVDCEVLWFFTLFEVFPCATILGPFRTEADRAAMFARIEGFNAILEDLVMTFSNDDPDHYYFYTDDIFTFPFTENHVSDLDCFHPSPEGQRILSEITWFAEDGPRFFEW